MHIISAKNYQEKFKQKAGEVPQHTKLVSNSLTLLVTHVNLSALEFARKLPTYPHISSDIYSLFSYYSDGT